MQRSSTKIGALATALAKAQSELANPEKSLTANLPSAPDGLERTFRYASLASGLELVRKNLGSHEIATVQATTIDRDTGLIRLTTTLVHASGEWMSSDWPVCLLSETASPHRMGTALTYARRYALFTLVGIAGEDDLDAPDLPRGALSDGHNRTEELAGGSAPLRQLSEPAAASTGQSRPYKGRASPPPTSAAMLAPEASADVRNQLIGELTTLTKEPALTAWAQRALPRKNQLSIPDAMMVEAAFVEQLDRFCQDTPAGSNDSLAEGNGLEPATAAEAASQPVIMLSKPVRERDRSHLKYVASQPCLICGRTPSDPHHLKFAESWMAGRKVSDRFTVPLCRVHHHELHRRGNERTWWQQKAIDPIEVASALWNKTHSSSEGDLVDNHGQPISGGITRLQAKPGVKSDTRPLS